MSRVSEANDPNDGPLLSFSLSLPLSYHWKIFDPCNRSIGKPETTANFNANVVPVLYTFTKVFV